jgi:hypothetical protein
VLLPPAWPADPSPEPLLSTDTGTLTEPGALTETTDPPADWLLLAEVELLPEALPLPDPLLATETGTFTEPGALTETTDPPVDWLLPAWLPVPLWFPVLPEELELAPEVPPLPDPLLATETGTLTELGSVAEIREPPVDWLLVAVELLPEALPLPELLLSAETGTLTEPGKLAEISDPPADWLVPAWLPVPPLWLPVPPEEPELAPEVPPLPELLLSAETGRLIAGSVSEISDPPVRPLPV